MLQWCRFLKKLEQGIHTSRSQYCQVTKWMDNLLCRMPCLLGLQTSISSCTVYHQGQVHWYVTSAMWHHSHNEPAIVNEGARLQGHLHWALWLLQSICGQLRRSRTRTVSKAMPKNQAHKLLLPSLLQACVQWTHQDIPYWYQRLDCWCSDKSSG